MKGKVLFNIVQDLDKSERHKILNICRKSGDKRHEVLYDYIKNASSDIELHQTKLSDLVNKKIITKKISDKENDKVLRRFIDFAVKEIENLKLKNKLDKDFKFRNFLLAQIYNKRNSQDLFNQYLKKTKVQAIREKDISFEAYCLDYEISNQSKFQKNKDLANLKDLLISKNIFTQKIYHKKVSEIHNTLSGLYMSNKNIFDELKNVIPIQTKELDALIQLAENSKASVIYKLAQARYNFLDKKVFERNVNEAENLVKKFDGEEKEKLKLQRRILFLKTVGGFHYGDELKTVYSNSKRVIDINNKLDFQDGLSAFYFLLIHLIYKGYDQNFERVFDEISEQHFNDNNAYMLTFIDAFILFLNEEYTKALRMLSYLSYSPNTYISNWSRLLEIYIHYKKENFEYCESLVNRLNRFLTNNTGNFFTYNSTKNVLLNFSDKLGMRTKKQKIDKESLSTLHRILFI